MGDWFTCSWDTTCFGGDFCADKTDFIAVEQSEHDILREERRLKRNQLSDLSGLIDLIQETGDIFAQIERDHLLEEAAQVAYWSKETSLALEQMTKANAMALRKATKAVNVLYDLGCDIEDGVRGPFECRSVKFGYDFDGAKKKTQKLLTDGTSPMSAPGGKDDKRSLHFSKNTRMQKRSIV